MCIRDSVLGNDGKIYDFYLDDSILYDYKKTVGHEVRMNWIIETLILKSDENSDSQPVLLTVRGVMDIELIGQSAYIEELGKSEEGIPYAPSVVIPDDVDLKMCIRDSLHLRKQLCPVKSRYPRNRYPK